jgi:hypothetical protein
VSTLVPTSSARSDRSPGCRAAFYVLDKGVAKVDDGIDTKKSAWIAAIIAVGCMLACVPLILFLRKRVLAKEDQVAAEMKAIQDAEAQTKDGGAPRCCVCVLPALR